jgi:hypothetical protein
LLLKVKATLSLKDEITVQSTLRSETAVDEQDTTNSEGSGKSIGKVITK